MAEPGQPREIPKEGSFSPARHAFAPPPLPLVRNRLRGPQPPVHAPKRTPLFHVKRANLTTETERNETGAGFETGKGRMLKGGGFGAHDPKHGGRLPRQIALGPPGALRQVRDIEPSVEKAERLVEGVLAPQRLEPGQLRQVAEKVARAVRLKKRIGRLGPERVERAEVHSTYPAQATEAPQSPGVKKAMEAFEAGLAARREREGKNKIGRPRFDGVRPWEAEGVSRATWFRRKKEVGGG